MQSNVIHGIVTTGFHTELLDLACLKDLYANSRPVNGPEVRSAYIVSVLVTFSPKLVSLSQLKDHDAPPKYVRITCAYSSDWKATWPLSVFVFNTNLFSR